MPKDNDMDLERYATASFKQYNGCQSASTREASRHCAIAVQHLDGRAFVINATIEEEANGALILSSARKQVLQTLTKNWRQRALRRLCMELIVGTARVTQVSDPL